MSEVVFEIRPGLYLSLWPSQFTIKSRIWSIVYVPSTDPGLTDEEDDYLLGCCRADQHKIWICTDQSPASMRDTLVHELMHACYASAPMMKTGIEDAYDREENIILFATEAFFEIVNNSDEPWWLSA